MCCFVFLTLLYFIPYVHPGRNTEQPVKASPKPAAREPCSRHSGKQTTLPASTLVRFFSLYFSMLPFTLKLSTGRLLEAVILPRLLRALSWP